MTSLAFRKRPKPIVFFVLSILSLSSLPCVVNAGGMAKMWDIGDPNGRKCVTKTDDATSSTKCDHPKSIMRLDYAIHKSIPENKRLAKYKIFQKDCEEEFGAGEDPVNGTSTVEDDLLLSLSAPSEESENITASVEFLPTENFYGSTWWSMLSNIGKEEQVVEFCVRVGLWLPPPANMEVNFRETNVNITVRRKSSDEGGDVVTSVEAENKDLRKVSVLVGGAKAKMNPAKEKQEESQDEPSEPTSAAKEEDKDEL